MSQFPKLKNSIDLHGLSIQQGFSKALMFVKVHRNQKTVWVKIITGRSGKMNAEFPKWMGNPSFKDHVEEFKHSDEYGAWAVRLRK